MIRVVSISDTHGQHRLIKDLQDGDILIHAGDFTNTGEEYQLRDFMEWFSQQPHKHKILIAGNHDVTLHEAYYDEIGGNRFHRQKRQDSAMCRALMHAYPGISYLEDSGINTEIAPSITVNIWGSPWQPEFEDWAFNLPERPQLLEKWRLIPNNIDILITHGPPHGMGDWCQSGVRAGCSDLMAEINNRIKPRLHIFGHIHESYGVTRNSDTIFVSACICTYFYRPTNRAIVIDLPIEKKLPGIVHAHA